MLIPHRPQHQHLVSPLAKSLHYSCSAPVQFPIVKGRQEIDAGQLDGRGEPQSERQRNTKLVEVHQQTSCRLVGLYTFLQQQGAVTLALLPLGPARTAPFQVNYFDTQVFSLFEQRAQPWMN